MDVTKLKMIKIPDDNPAFIGYNNNNDSAVDFANKIGIDFANSANVASFICNSSNIYWNEESTKLLSKISLNTVGYEDKKDASIYRFLPSYLCIQSFLI